MCKEHAVHSEWGNRRVETTSSCADKVPPVKVPTKLQYGKELTQGSYHRIASQGAEMITSFVRFPITGAGMYGIGHGLVFCIFCMAGFATLPSSSPVSQ